MRALRSHGVNWIRGAAFIVINAAALAVATAATTSLAIAQAPIIDGGQPVSRPSRASSGAAPAQEGGSATGALYLQLQTLQQEVSELRGIVEEQRHQLETLKQQSLDRYTDLDSRLSQPGQAQPAPVAAVPGAVEAPSDTPAEPAAAPGSTAPGAAAPVAAASGMQTARPEEYEAYQKAYAKLKSQDVGGAIKAFNSFIATYPGSSLAGNAYYWLGKAYLQPPQDAAKAQQAFAKVSGDLPQHTKAPDALYELAKIHYSKGDKGKARTLFQQVIDNYGTSGSTAPQLAKQFLDQNYK